MKMKYMPMAEYCKEYMRYLGVAKTARRSYAESVRLLEARGFKDISTFKTLKPGDKVYRGYLDRTVMAAVIGKKPVAEVGLKVVGGHTDAPRLDLKPKPLYEKGPYVYFDCHIYGGIKKYQWLVRPLALYGTIVRKDGSKVNVAVGDDPKDPVFMISDILPHLGYDQAKKTRDEFFPAEDLDVIAWTTFAKPEKDAKKDAGPKADKNALVEFLKKTYKVDEEDLLSAELEIVPAGMPREVGFDRALERSSMLSADVTATADPHFADQDSTGNGAVFHKGPAASKYTGGTSKGGSSDCEPEFVAKIRKIMDDGGVTWQMAELGKMEKGGGGTIAQYMSRFGMAVLDMGTPLWNMHAPWERAAKDDCWNTYRAYSAYLRS